MTALDFVGRVIDALNQLGIPFMLVGSFSSNLYGIPRSTKHLDFVIQLDPSKFQPLVAALTPELTSIRRSPSRRSPRQPATG